ncbi:MAG: hypothetical protein ACK5M7_03010 [Draconibacterium sp.]
MMQKFRQYRKSELIVYNNYDNTIIQLINGRQNYIITQLPIDSTGYSRQMVENVVVNKKLNPPLYLLQNDSYEDSQLLLRDNLICFNGKIVQSDNNDKSPKPNLTPDFLIRNTYFAPEEYKNKKGVYVITSRYIPSENPAIHSLPVKGAFQTRW